MREILFKGKRVDNGKWIEGNLVREDLIIESVIGYDDNDGTVEYISCKRVLPETVSQFTGFLDENGKKIFEGDILNCTDVYNDEPFKTTVRFKDGGFLVDCYGCDYDITCIGFLDDEIKLEIVGNIHEELKETK
jgi:uncharacterized phage protein (TIGR01671 family)